MASEEPPAAPERAENPFAPEPVERVPLPRAVVRTPQKKKRVAEIIDVRPSRPTQPFIGHRSGFADGGEVDEEFDPPLFLRSGMEEVPAAPSRPRSQFEAKPLGGNKGALATDLANARYLRDNPGKTLSAVPSVVGNIVGSAIENRREPGPRQMGAPRKQEKTWLPGVGNIFDMSASAAEADHDPRPIEPVINPAAEEAKAIEAAKVKIAAQRTSVAAARAKKNEELAKAREGVLAGMERDLAQLEGPQSPLGARRTAAMENFKEELKRWQLRNENLASRKMNAGQPYAVKFPEWQEGMQKWSAPASAGTGALFGTVGALKGHPLKAALGAGLMGAGEGVYASLWPTLQDAEHLPPGSEHNKGAIARLYEGDPDTWKRAGVGAMTHGPLALGASMLTSHLGDIASHTAKGVGRGVAATARGLGNAADWWRRAPAPSSAAGNILPAAASAPEKLRTTFTGQNGEIVHRYVNNGKTYWNKEVLDPKTGKTRHLRTSAPDISKWKAGEPTPYGTGGSVYAAGGVGSVDFEDQWDPTTKAIQDGTFDPQGDNFPSGIAPFARGPMPRANPFREDPYVAQAAAEPPPAAGPIPRQGLLQNATNEAPRSQGLADNPWMALLNAGLGTMASAGQRDARGLPMSPMAAIGHGGQQGLKTLETQREAAMKQQSLEQAAKRLQQQAQHQIDQLEETKRHNTETEKARKEGLAAGKWKVIGPTADGEGVIQMDSETGEHRILPVKMGQKAKPLPTTAGNKLEKYGQTHATVSSLGSEFKDEYSGYGLKGVGDSANWAARQLGIGNEKAANWWQQHARYTNEVRHGLFGAALTGHESSEWEKSDVNPGTQPSVVKENLARQKEIVLGAMGRKALSLKEDGYNPKAIEAQMGVSFATLEKAAKQADAIEWARNNRGDPRAKQILQMHGRE
jgi:hypothetical protein